MTENTNTPTDTEVVDAIATYLGTWDEWSGADALENIATLIGRVRPNPGVGDGSTYAQEFLAATGRTIPETWNMHEPDDTDEVVQAEPYASDDKTYSIVRFRQEGGNEVIESGLTLEEAQEHCSRDDTRGDGWFDGYQQD